MEEMPTNAENFIKITDGDMPVQGIHILKVGRIYSFCGICPHPCTNGGEIWWSSVKSMPNFTAISAMCHPVGQKPQT